MNKTFTLLLFWLAIAAIATAQKSKTYFRIHQNSPEEYKVSFRLGNYNQRQVHTGRGQAIIPQFSEGHQLQVKGAPDVPAFTQAILVPDRKDLQVQVTDTAYYEIRNVEVAPSKGHLLRTQNPTEIPYTWSDMYQKDAFWPGELASMRKAYVFRSYRGQPLRIKPLQYNPVTRTLRVYTRMELLLTPGKPAVQQISPLQEKGRPQVTRAYDEIYSRHFLNYPQLRYEPVKEKGNMLIITPGEWEAALQPLAAWKRQTGMHAEIVTLQETGDATSEIQDYVKNYYNEHGLTFLLLAGDAEQLPPGYKSGDSDAVYGHIDGDDSYAEVIVGRLSAENEAHLQTQVKRALDYEKLPDTEGEWYARGVGIASSEGTGDDGEYDYEHMRNALADLDDYTYSETAELFDGSQDGEDAEGNPAPDDLATELETGAGILLYVGHGSDVSWATSSFSVDDINALTNTRKLPFIYDVACVNGNFVGQTCFAEAWVRASHEGKPTGAVAIQASTINQSWNPPMAAQDEMVDILTESYSDNIKRTYGGIAINGCMLMNDEYGDDGASMTDTWTIFGDPSLTVRTRKPAKLRVEHPKELFLAQESMQVSGTAGALLTLTDDDRLLATHELTGESAPMSLPEITEPDTLTLTVTHYNHIPYSRQIEVIPSETPYLAIDSVLLNGSPEKRAFYGDTMQLELGLINRAQNDTALDIRAALRAYGDDVKVLDSVAVVGELAAGERISAGAVYRIYISPELADGQTLPLQVHISARDHADSAYTWKPRFSLKAAAPRLRVQQMQLEDFPEGNANGTADAGETLHVNIRGKNTGSAPLDSVHARLTVIRGVDFVSLKQERVDLGRLAAGEAFAFRLPASLDEASPQDSSFALRVRLSAASNPFYNRQDSGNFRLTATPQYCASAAGDDADTQLERFRLDTFTNASEGGCAAYSDFTTDTIPLQAGDTVPFAITAGTCNSDYMKAAKIFVDWNADGDFSDSGELIHASRVAEQTFTSEGFLQVPANRFLGPRRMRIVVAETENAGNIKPCGEYSYGETEDYTLEILPKEKPVAGFTASRQAITSGMEVQLTDTSLNHPIRWKWEISPGNAGGAYRFVQRTSATSSQPVLAFDSAGTYSVRLAVSSYGGADTLFRQDYLTVNPVTEAPAAYFALSDTALVTGDTLHLRDRSTQGPEQWLWKVDAPARHAFRFVHFTDSTSRHPELVLEKPGAYGIYMKTANNFGASDVVHKQVQAFNGVRISDQSTQVNTALFYDSGGPHAPYGNNETDSITLYPAQEGGVVQLDFRAFDVEAGSDSLMVFDGNSIAAPLMGSYSTANMPAKIQAGSQGGSLTLLFRPGSHITRKGWEAKVSNAQRHAVNFLVQADGEPVSGASINTAGFTDSANAEGSARLYLHKGNYSLQVSKPGMKSLETSYTVQTNQTLKVHMEPDTFTMQLAVLDHQDSSAVEAQVQVNDREVTASSLNIQDLLYKDTLQIRITAPRYQTLEKEWVVKQTVDTTFMLKRNRHNLAIGVQDDAGKPVDHAVIDLGLKRFTSGDEGQAKLDMPWGNYPLEIRRPGYRDYMDSLHVRGELDTTFTLYRLHDVLITVVDASGPLPEAELFINDSAYALNANGELRSDFISGEYNMEISHSDYNTYQAVLTLSQDTSIRVAMVPLGMYAMKKAHIQVYPNPAQDKLHIRSGNSPVLQVTARDMHGRTIWKKSVGGYRKTLNISDLMPGVYLLQIHTPSSIFRQRLIVK